MSGDGNVRIQVSVDAKTGQAQVVALGQSFETLGAKGARSASALGSAFASLSGRLSGLVSVAGAVGAAWQGVQLGSQIEQSAFKMRATFQGQADAMIAKSKELAAAMHHIFSAEQIQDAMARTADGMMRYGIAGEQYNLLIARSANVAAAKGIELMDAITRVESAMRGEAEASEYLGVTLNDTYMKSLAFNGALKDQWEKLSDLDKAFYRYHELMNQTQKYTTGAAQAADTLSGAFSGLWNRLKNEGAPALSWLNEKVKSLVTGINEAIDRANTPINKRMGGIFGHDEYRFLNRPMGGADQTGGLPQKPGADPRSFKDPWASQWSQTDASQFSAAGAGAALEQQNQRQAAAAEQARSSWERIFASVQRGRDAISRTYTGTSDQIASTVASSSAVMEVSLDKLDAKGKAVKSSLGKKARLSLEDAITPALDKIAASFDRLKARMEAPIKIKAQATMAASSEKPMTEKLEELTAGVTQFGGLVNNLNPILSVDGSNYGVQGLQSLYLEQVKRVVDAVQLSNTVGRETSMGSWAYKQLYANQEAGARAGLSALNDLLSGGRTNPMGGGVGSGGVNITVNVTGGAADDWRAITRNQIIPELRAAGAI